MQLNRKGQLGVGMVDVMMAMAIGTMLAVAYLKYAATTRQGIAAKNYGEEMQSVYAAGANYASTNQTAILAATVDGTGASSYCMVNVSSTGTGGTAAYSTATHTCAIDVTWLKYQGLLPPSFSPLTPEGSAWAVIYKQDYNGSTPTGAIEMLVVPATQVGAITFTPYVQLANQGAALDNAAALMGSNAGVVPANANQPCPWNATDSTQQFICGTSGGWRVKVSDFTN